MIARVCWIIFLSWMMKRSTKKVSSSSLWLTPFVKRSTSQHPMLRRKLYGCGSSSTSLEWHPPLMVLSCYTATTLESLFKPRSWSLISAPSILCATITLSRRSWIKVTSTFKRSTKKKIWPIHLLKLSGSRNSMITNWRWVYDTVPIGFSPSENCWKICPKINRQQDCAHTCKCI